MEAKQDNVVFDPYVKWLGIRTSERPPNHYDLLGLSQFESDPDVIAAAAERQMAHVRRYQNGPHSAVSQKLLNQLAAAKLCLQKAEQKADYDAALRASCRQPRRVWVGLAAAVGAVGLVAGLGYGFSQLGSAPRPNQERELVAVGAPAQPATTPAEEVGGGQVEVVDVPQEEPERETDTAPAPPPWATLEAPDRPSPPRKGTRNANAFAVDQALYQRDILAAWKAQAAFEKAAETPAERAEAERLYRVIYLVERYWVAADQALANSALMGATIKYLDQPVKVAAVHANVVTLQAADGSTKEYATVRQEMELRLATALVRWQLDEGSKTDFIIATALIKDQRGDKAQAKNYLERANSGGQSIEEIFPINAIYTDARAAIASDAEVAANVDESPEPSQGSTVSPAETLIATPRELAQSTTSSGRGRHEVPRQDELDDAAAMIKALYEKEYRRGSIDAKVLLGKLLLTKANQTTDDLAAKYVLYDEARRLGVEGRSPDLAANAIKAIAHNFDVDEQALKLEFVERSSGTVSRAGGQLLLLNECRRAIRDSIRDDDFPKAEVYVTFAQKILRKTREPVLRSYAKEIVAQFKAVQRELQRAQPAFDALATNPDDPEANQLVGEYLCFTQFDFESGLAHLAKGTQPKLVTLAEQELAETSTPYEVADEWWSLARANKEATARAMYDHASRLYADSIHTMSGLTLQRAEVRILTSQSPLTTKRIALSALEGETWSINWMDGPEWQEVEFNNNIIAVKANAPKWHAQAHEMDGTVRFLSKDKQSAYVLAGGKRLLAFRFALSTGYLESIGLCEVQSGRG